MSQTTCLVCNTQEPLGNYIKDIFSDKAVLPSNKSLFNILTEILGKPLEENKIHTKLLCRKCFSSCIDYDGYQSKINTLKTMMCNNYTRTQKEINLNAPIMAQPKNSLIVERDKPMTKVVVPASKLQPLPPDFQLNIGQLGAVSRSNINNKLQTVTPLINLKVTIGSSVFTQSVKTSTVKICKPSEVETDQTTKATEMSDKWSVEIPRDIFSNNDDNNNGDEQNGDDEMEIDEGCTLAVIPSNNSLETANIKMEPSQITEEMEYINVNVLPSEDNNASDGNFILSNLKILKNEGDNNGSDEQHTIVVNGDNTSILQMMAGQKFVYENGELSLVMDEHHDDDGNNDDEHDSNDESQIELQVSGDEETANAIIAAAQEKGGAFIKVESGEMYRVKSVQSKTSSSLDISSFYTKDGNKFKCVMCNDDDDDGDGEDKTKTLLDASAMMQHLKSEHDATLYICQFCGCGMRRRQEYTKHLAEHTGPATKVKARTHECPVCRKQYNSRTLLREHANTHSGARPYACAVCGKTYASKYTHMAHMKTHEVRPRPFSCKRCNKSFLSKQNLIQHEKTHLGIRNFICKVCGKAFVTQHNLEVHGVVHSGERPFACTECSKSFARKAELVDHLRIHTGERPFECAICGARFAQRSNLHSHARATHAHDKRHRCTHCDKRFKRRRLLEYHIKATHTGERPLKCDICHSTFVYPEHYKKHLRIHSGERPYFCEICGKSFNSCDNRNTHRFTHSDKKPYECLTCGLSYMRKRLLIAHMNSSGHLAESIVVNQPRVTRVNESGLATLVLDQTDLSNNVDDPDTDTILTTSGKIELIASEDKADNSIEEDATKLYINAVSENFEQPQEDPLIETVHSTDLETQTAQIGDEVLRLIQVKLPDGKDGWVALNDYLNLRQHQFSSVK